MTAAEWVLAIAIFLIAGVMAFLSFRCFRERGFLMNNAYIYASKEEREAMDKKPYYRQSAIVFCLMSAVFTVMGLSVVLRNRRVALLEIPILVAAVVYAFVSTARIRERAGK